MIRRPPRSTLSSSSAASDVYKRQPSSLAFRMELLEKRRLEALKVLHTICQLQFDRRHTSRLTFFRKALRSLALSTPMPPSAKARRCSRRAASASASTSASRSLLYVSRRRDPGEQKSAVVEIRKKWDVRTLVEVLRTLAHDLQCRVLWNSILLCLLIVSIVLLRPFS